MSLNVKLLKKIREKILTEPGQFAMQNWFTTEDELRYSAGGLDDLDRPKIPNCGTAACIGGWAVVLGKKSARGKPATAARVYGHGADTARELLGLGLGEEEHFDGGAALFYVTSWPAKYRELWREAKTLKRRARVAAWRIDAYIKQYGGK